MIPESPHQHNISDEHWKAGISGKPFLSAFIEANATRILGALDVMRIKR
jgi:hypothetical protein